MSTSSARDRPALRLPGDARRPVLRTAAVLLLFAAAVLFARCWEADLYDDPLLYASIAREMVRSGDWWTPHWGPDPYFKKPPLIFWLTALDFLVFGAGRAAAVFWSLALAAVSVPLTYLLARRWFGEWTALWAGVVLATTPRFLKDSMSLRLDSPLTCFLLAAMLAALAAAAGRPRLYLAAGAMTGLAVLTKGPPGALGLFPFLWLAAVRPGGHRWWRCPWAWGGLAIAAALPGTWYGSMVALHGPPFLRVVLLSEGVSRLVSNMAEADRWAYLLMMTQYYWPWLPFLTFGVVLYARELRRRGWRWEGSYLAAFTVLYLGAVALAETKYYRYFQPAYPFLSMVAAMPLAGWIAEARRPAVLRTLAAGALVIAVLTSVLPVKLHGDRNAGLVAVARELEERTEGWEIAVSRDAADHNLLSALWFHTGRAPREMHPRFFSAPPPSGPCFHLLYRPHERGELGASLELSGERPFRNDRKDLLLADACRSG